MLRPFLLMVLTAGLGATSGCGPRVELPPGAESVTVTLDGGHETDPQDHGRPVALIGPALGVTPEIFRDAFSGVTPARDGHPTEAEARANKAVLMSALGPHGITNERLDEVSNFYRYRPRGGSLWRHREAEAVAIVKGGKITGFQILEGGYGYTTPPRVKVTGFPRARVTAKIEFGTDLKRNGRLAELTIAP